jgi:hypothetical protein
LSSLFHRYLLSTLPAQLKALTVPALKEICTALGIPVSGAKKLVVDRITAALAVL